jgi:hypothetical protein
MICQACRNKKHDRCPGDTWCDCQHRPLPLPSIEDTQDMLSEVEKLEEMFDGGNNKVGGS